MKMFAVTWGSAAIDPEGNLSGYCGNHGIYLSRSKALEEMQTCLEAQKQETIEAELELHSGEPECEEALDYLRRHMVTYGNTVEGYFELDYETYGGTKVEVYIRVEEVEVNA